MESLSRPLHRRKLSNANSFSSKNAYDGVFSGHRPKYDGGAPSVHVDEYREIFGQGDCSIPVLDLSGLDESGSVPVLDDRSKKPDYGMIFGGFRDMGIAISYQELVARDKASECRAPSSMSGRSEDFGDLSSHESSDALKQFNLLYNKISQRSKDGLDVTTHVTQLDDVPGFTCFIDESASQPNKETAKETSSSISRDSKWDFPEKQTTTSNDKVNSSKREFPEKETTTNNVKVNSNKWDFPEKQTTKINNGNSSKLDYSGKETTENNAKVSSSKLNFSGKETAENNSKVSSSKHDFPEKQTGENNAKVSSSKHDFPEKQTGENNAKVKHDFPEKQIEQNNAKVKHDFPEKQIEHNNAKVNSSNPDFPEKQIEQNNAKVKHDFPEKQIKENNAKVNSSNPDFPEKQTTTNNVKVNSSKQGFVEKQTSQSSVDLSRYQEESLYNDRSFKTSEADLTYPTKILSPPESMKETKKQKSSETNNVLLSPPALSQETEKQKASVTNNVHSSEKVDLSEKQTAQIGIESQSKHGQDESFSFNTCQADFKSYPSKVSSSTSASATNLDSHKDYQKRSTTRNEEFPPTFFDEELNVNSASAALRKAIENAQESIRIAKESVGRNKGGLKGFSSKSFKNSLKVKARVADVDTSEGQKVKEDIMEKRDHKNGSTVIFSNFADGEKLFGAKKVVNETHGKVLESVKNSEIPLRSPFELKDNKSVCNSKQVVGRTEGESIESSACEDPQKDNERPNGFLVFESCEKEQVDTESNDLMVCQKVEPEKKILQLFDQNSYEKKFTFRLLENNMQENHEKHDEEVACADKHDEDERKVKEDGGTGSQSEEEKFYDVCEVEMLKNAQTDAYIMKTNDLSQNEDFENHKAEENCGNSSSEYDDAEENENLISARKTVDDTEEASKVDQNGDYAESSKETDDVTSSHAFQVEYKEAIEKEICESISSDDTEDGKDECETKSGNLENCDMDDMEFGQNDVRSESESSLDTIHGMEIEVKEYNESEEAVEEEENNLQQSYEETPEIIIEMDTRTPQEPNDACRESEPEPIKKVEHDKEEREREWIKSAVDRAIREARERAFAEVRQRVLADNQEKVTKASIDKISAKSKLKAERALVERATAEARQRALEKSMKISEPRIQVNETKQTSSTSQQPTTESALRSKAKLEKHNRIMERAAKALAEKERRDLLALKEQAERSRLAENLDADIKRWSNGKEGNLRALLSTLQYVLGAESGWHPVSLTEIITTSAVKKAYRKATLCVHPDKLQQRGASIQQKYICEKVFDLLKAAWNRFNSEER